MKVVITLNYDSEGVWVVEVIVSERIGNDWDTGIGVGKSCGSDVVKGGMDWHIGIDVLEDVGECYWDNSVGADNSDIDMWVQDVQNISVC